MPDPIDELYEQWNEPVHRPPTRARCARHGTSWDTGLADHCPDCQDEGRAGEPLGPVLFDEAKRLADPTPEQLAASIGCEPHKILRSVLNKHKKHEDGRDIWTSFVEQGDEEKVAVFETVWPQ